MRTRRRDEGNGDVTGGVSGRDGKVCLRRK